MNRTTQSCSVIVILALWIIIPLCAPWLLSEKNTLLEKFINEQLITLLGIIVPITLASTATLSLTLNTLEERSGKPIFYKTRATIKKSAYWLVFFLFCSVIILTIKFPILKAMNDNEIAASYLNGSGLVIILFNILILIDLMQMTFKIPPNIPEEY